MILKSSNKHNWQGCQTETHGCSVMHAANGESALLLTKTKKTSHFVAKLSRGSKGSMLDEMLKPAPLLHPRHASDS